MENWQHKPLARVIDRITTGSTPSTKRSEFFNGDVPWFTPGDIGVTRDLIESSRYITDVALSEGKARLFETGMLLVTCIGNIGRVGVLRVPASSNQQITALKFKPEVDVDYAYYWFVAHQNELERHTNQAVVPILNNAGLKRVAFSYPPLEEQRRIAGTLARADRLRRLRRFAADLGSTYLQSVFIEMFGDGSDFETVKFEELMMESPRNGLYLPSSEYGSGTPIIRIDNFYGGILSPPDTFKRVRATQKHIEKFAVQNGEILINRVNSLEYLGKCALVRGISEPTVFESNMMRIRLDKEQIHPIYLARFLTTPQAHAQILQRAKKAVNQASINQQDVKSLPIPTPPLPLQAEFAAIVRRFEHLRAQQRESERQAEHLFQTLLHRAFAE